MDKQQGDDGIRRRSFFSAIGAGVIGTAAAGNAAPVEKSADAPSGVPLKLVINGQGHTVFVQPRWTLLYLLREHMGMVGTKVGCERGECGTCTVLIDNVPRYACMTLALEAEGCEITTVEGVMRGEQLGPVQQAFVEQDGMQCGYCTPGQVMAAEGLLRKNPDPSMDEIRAAMAGNLCRCGAYHHIARAVHRAAELRKTGGAQ